MGKNNKVIDFLDLSIVLPRHCVEFFQTALAHFIDHYDYVEVNPRIKKGILRINSNDLIAFIGYIDPTQINELDLHRFRLSAKEQIEQQLLRATDLDFQSHYKWCLAALKAFEVGRHLNNADSE